MAQRRQSPLTYKQTVRLAEPEFVIVTILVTPITLDAGRTLGANPQAF